MNYQKPIKLEVFFEEIFNYRLGALFYMSFVKFLELQGNETVLDFGCGGGACSKFIAPKLKKGGKLICLDASGYWIEKARKRLANFKHIEFLLQKIQQANIKEGSIDCVCIHFVLHDIPKQQRKEIIGSLASKLKPGGQLAIKEPTRELHGMPAEEITQLAYGAGLKKEEQRTPYSLFDGKLYMARFLK